MGEDRTLIERLIDEMTGSGFPWVARVYFLLIVFFGLTLIGTAIAAHHQGAGNSLPENDLYSQLLGSLRTASSSCLAHCLDH